MCQVCARYGPQVTDPGLGWELRQSIYDKLGLALPEEPVKKVLIYARGKGRSFAALKEMIAIVESYGVPYTYVNLRNRCLCTSNARAAAAVVSSCKVITVKECSCIVCVSVYDTVLHVMFPSGLFPVNVHFALLMCLPLVCAD